MKILLVRPPRIKQAVTLSDFMYSEPLGLEMLYRVLDKNHHVEIFDMMCDNKPLKEMVTEFVPEVVAITSLCIDVNAVIKIAKEINKIMADMGDDKRDDVVNLSLIFYCLLNYLCMRSATSPKCFGMNLKQSKSWDRIDDIVDTLVDRFLIE